jgi:hypothetical protein
LTAFFAGRVSSSQEEVGEYVESRGAKAEERGRFSEGVVLDAVESPAGRE